MPGAAPVSTEAGFQVDPFWPKPLPEGWLLGNVVGVATDAGDNVSIIHRPGSQAGAGETPTVIAFDPAGNVVQSWGGPGGEYDWGTQTHGIHVDYQPAVWRLRQREPSHVQFTETAVADPGDVDENRRTGAVEAPDRVMYQLKVPQSLAGLEIDRDKTFAKQVVTRPMPAVVVAGRDLDR